jgi:hypothetical protein
MTLPKNPTPVLGGSVHLMVNPLVIVFTEPGEDPKTGTILYRIHPAGLNHQEYGIIVCDLVRHVANAYGVPERAVWKWVDAERRKPTTKITGRMEED